LKDSELFDMMIDKLTKEWEPELRLKFISDYEEMKSAGTVLKNIFISIAQNQELRDQFEREVNKRQEQP